MQAWFTAAQLAKLKLPGLPKSERGVQLLAQRSHWRRQQRQGRGGGWEYAVESLPEEARLELLRRETASAAPARAPAPAPRPAAPVIAADLRDFQRDTMDARQMILDHITNQALLLGVSRLKAEAEFCRLARTGQLAPHLQNAVAVANARAGQGRVLSAGTLRRWRRTYEREGAASLAVRDGKTHDEMPAWLEPFMRLYAIPSKPSVAGVYEELKRRQPELQLPSIRTVHRMVEGLDAITANKGRFGPREMKRFRAFKVRDFSKLQPGDIYTADGHKADMEVQSPLTGHAVRPEIISVLDVATRRCVGWAAGFNESGLLVGSALLNACRESVPVIFYVDNGSGFVNEYMSNPDYGMLGRLNIEMRNSIPYNSQSRGVIERFHQTCWVRAAKFLPAYMGADMDPQVKSIVFKRSRAELQQTGRSKYLLSWDQFLEWAQSCVNAYNSRPHSSFPKIRDPETFDLRHPSPNEVWQSWIERGWQPELPDQAAIDDARRPYEWRIVNRGQVQILGGTYFHERLDAEGWHGKRVKVGYDLHASDRVWVRAEDDRLICIAQLDANKVDYMPQPFIEQLRQKRAQARIRNAEKRIEEQRIEAGDAPKPVGYQVIESLSPEESARIEAKIAEMERPQLPAPEIVQPADADDRPTFMSETAYWRWLFAGGGSDEEQSELRRRMQRRSFCDLHDLPFPGDAEEGREAEMRAAI